jgi:hypothetical protein
MENCICLDVAFKSTKKMEVLFRSDVVVCENMLKNEAILDVINIIVLVLFP